MLLDRETQLRDGATVNSRKRMQRDREEKASPRIQPVLAHLEVHFLDHGFTVAVWWEACGVRDNALSTRFARDLGYTPGVYLRRRRMEVAAEMLEATDLKVWKIADLVCYPNVGSFCRAFKEWSGLKPSDYRKTARKAAREAESLELDMRDLARALLQGEVGRMDRAVRVRLASHLLSFDEPPRTLAMDGAKLERGIALAHWEDLRYLPPAEQKDLVRRHYSLTTPALFDLLREKSREEGRKDREAGVRVAELAIASLDGIAAHLTPDDLANRKAQGSAWLGNALRLALDYPAAERTFARARKLLPEEPDSQVLAEVWDLESDLYLCQSKFDKALELKNRALELFRSLGNKRSLAETLLSRAIAIGRSLGYESAIPDFLNAVEVAEPVNDPHLTACAYQSLATAYALAERPDEALQMLPVARTHCANAGDRLLTNQLQWIEGLIARQRDQLDLAEEFFLTVRSGFVAMGESGLAAIVDLDLAELYLEQRRESKALSHALGAIPVFEHFGKHPEAVAALTLLGEVAAEQQISLELLRALRGHAMELSRLQYPSPTSPLPTGGREGLGEGQG
jgi:AraC-like DNA-binding protein